MPLLSPSATDEQIQAHYTALPRTGGLVSKCEMWLPPQLEGATVVDLFCRRGKGVYGIAERVGEQGLAYGVDPSSEFIEDAIAHAAENSPSGSYEGSNMRFLVGVPEKLVEAGVPEASADIVIINSALNLVCSLPQSLEQIAAVLKPGGEFFHAGLVVDGELPVEVAEQLAEKGSAFGTAPLEDELIAAITDAGFDTVSIVGRDQVDTRRVEELVGDAVCECSIDATFAVIVVSALKLG